ncbi:uncharacterized protein LOC136084621 [Hydra vulgaris]|uniref:Uncharacterized protein LOC136084621 n=1 Tax=Hydra vulgaris TaxID=6087 RepID=A0ABM4CH28_HYDVU
MVVLIYDMGSRFISKDLSTDELLSEYLLPRSSLAFDIPNFSELAKERVQRNNLFLNGIRSELEISSKDLAAIKIQKVYRGYVGRKKYFGILYESIQKSEILSKQYQEQLAIESEALIDSYRIERELEDNDVVERNKLRFLNANASVIQRVWRKKKRGLAKKEHICCFCNDEYYPSLYEYYSKTRKICFCCEKHKICHNEIDFSSKLTTMIDDSIVYDENISLTKYTLDEKATKNSFSQISNVLENNFDKNDKLKNYLKDEYSPNFFMVHPSLEYNDKCKRNKRSTLGYRSIGA